MPADLPEPGSAEADDGQDTLFAPDRLQLPPGTDPLAAVVAVHAEQQRRLAAIDDPEARGRYRLLLAAESAGALSAAEMGHDGLPWRTDVHDRLLTELLGPARPSPARSRACSPSSRPSSGRRSAAARSTPTRTPRCCAPSPRPASSSTPPVPGS